MNLFGRSHSLIDVILAGLVEIEKLHGKRPALHFDDLGAKDRRLVEKVKVSRFRSKSG